jgi:hypothetical protein
MDGDFRTVIVQNKGKDVFLFLIPGEVMDKPGHKFAYDGRPGYHSQGNTGKGSIKVSFMINMSFLVSGSPGRVPEIKNTKNNGRNRYDKK